VLKTCYKADKMIWWIAQKSLHLQLLKLHNLFCLKETNTYLVIKKDFVKSPFFS